MKIAHINENNQLLGWYSKDIHKEIPTPNIEVTEEQWQIAIDNGHNKVNEDGTTELFDFRTAEEIAKADKQAQIAQAKRYLEETDWIVTKIAETQALGADIAELLTKYSVELAQREASRALINTLEN